MRTVSGSLTVLLLFLFTPGPTAAQMTSLPDLVPIVSDIHLGVRQMDEAMLLQARESLDDVEQSTRDSQEYLYWNAYLEYRLATMLMDQNSKRDEAGKCIERGVKQLEKIHGRSGGNGETWALLATLTAMKIKMNRLSALWLGPRTDDYYEKSRSLNADNPRLHYLEGIITLYKPGFVGGGAENAKKLFKKALELFAVEKEKPADPLTPRWGAAECYYFLGETYLELGETVKAKKAFENALSMDSSSKLVTQKLADIEQNLN